MEPEALLAMAKQEDEHWWFVGRRKILGATIDKLLHKQPASTLEIGCGTGGNIQMLSKRCKHFQAMEPSTIALAHASAKHPDTDIKQGALPDNIPFDGPYDLITMLDVLEHIDNHHAALDAIKPLINADGRLLITVPAYPSLWGPHDIEHHHFRRYTSKSIKTLLEQHSWRIEFISHYNSLLFLPVWLIRMLSKHKKPSNKSVEQWLPPVWINNLLAWLFALERHPIIRRISLPFGLSILAIATLQDNPRP